MLRKSANQRFFEKVILFSEPPGCWRWNSSKNRDGYSKFWFNKKGVAAYRYAYELFIGPCPEGLEPDHTCRVRDCVNPWHLKWMTRQENCLLSESFAADNAQKTHCPKGHPYDESNTLKANKNSRRCRACKREQSYERRKRLAEAEGRFLGVANRDKTFCPRGHPYDFENTVYLQSGSRWCRTCLSERRKTGLRADDVEELTALAERLAAGK